MAYSLLISPISGDESGFRAGLMVLLRITQLPKRKRCARGCLGDEGDETGSRRPGLVIAASAGLIAAAGEMQADTRTGSRSPDQGACVRPSRLPECSPIPRMRLTIADLHSTRSSAGPLAETDVILRDERRASPRLDLLHGP